ncbi:MAG: carbohydrate ABC transporter permease [Clostridia bacterium]|nr:carbohydrate ABC transporter permease [Clostridia bacterium]
MRSKSHIKDTKGERIFYLLNGLFLTIFLIFTLYPLMCVISGAISDPIPVARGEVTFYPKGFSLRGFEINLQNPKVLRGFGNSLFYTVVGTVLNLFITVITGYVMSRKELPGRTAISFFMAFTMWFSGGLIPTFLLVRDLGLFNTRWALLIPGMLNVWNMIVCRTFINSTIPEEMFEAASIDGCGYMRFLFSMVLPLSSAIIAVLTLWYAIGHWNSYFNALIYVYEPELQPLQLYLRATLIENIGDLSDVEASTESLGIQELIKNSLILIACLPLWILYPFVQKFFVKGVMIGSVKG